MIGGHPTVAHSHTRKYAYASGVYTRQACVAHCRVWMTRCGAVANDGRTASQLTGGTHSDAAVPKTVLKDFAKTLAPIRRHLYPISRVTGVRRIR